MVGSPAELASGAALAKDIEKTHPGAAGSLREGVSETLAVIRLGVPPTLARTLRSTNPIESMIEIARDHSTNVKRWRDGDMALRWCAAGMLEARKQFRRVNGHLHRATAGSPSDAVGARRRSPGSVGFGASAIPAPHHNGARGRA